MKKSLVFLTRERDDIFKEFDDFKKQQVNLLKQKNDKIVDLENNLKLIAGENDRLIDTLEERDKTIENLHEIIEEKQINQNSLKKDHEYLKK